MAKQYRLSRLRNFDSTFVKAIQYFEEHSSSSRAQRFEDAVFDCIEIISLNPHLFQIRYKDIRAGIVRGFPYLVLYRIHEGQNLIQFTRLVSQSQNWLK